MIQNLFKAEGKSLRCHQNVLSVSAMGAEAKVTEDKLVMGAGQGKRARPEGAVIQSKHKQ